jgi:Fur family transcriptional regulator, ferric uptake regulator
VVTQAVQPSAWAKRATYALREAGYRQGGARRAILELLDEQECALTAPEMQRALAGRKREASRATIYRVLDELESVGVVHRVELGQGIVRYEPVRDGAGHHHHLVCERCGRLEPFTDAELERAISRLSDRVPLDVSVHEIVIRGECRVCAQ